MNPKYLNKVEVLNKYVVDYDIDFEAPREITYVFYDLVFDREAIVSVTYVIIKTPQANSQALP